MSVCLCVCMTVKCAELYHVLCCDYVAVCDPVLCVTLCCAVCEHADHAVLCVLYVCVSVYCFV